MKHVKTNENTKKQYLRTLLEGFHEFILLGMFCGFGFSPTKTKTDGVFGFGGGVFAKNKKLKVLLFFERQKKTEGVLVLSKENTTKNNKNKSSVCLVFCNENPKTTKKRFWEKKTQTNFQKTKQKQ